MDPFNCGTNSLFSFSSPSPSLSPFPSQFPQIIRTLTNAVAKDGDFVSCLISPKGAYVYAVAEDHQLYCFDAVSGKVEHVQPVSEKDVIGMTHHPKQNIIATYAMDSQLKLWKP